MSVLRSPLISLRSPVIPPSTNTNTTFSKTLQASTLRVQNSLSFFGSLPETQQTVYPTDSSVLQLLQRYGLAESYYFQEEGPLIGTGSVGGSYQGVSVSLSTDGNTLAIGGPIDNSHIGAVWIFIRRSGVWLQQGNKLIGSGAVGNAEQGVSVSLSSDGNTLAVGGQFDNSNVGATWIFTRSGTTWSQQGSKLVGTGAIGQAKQGTVVSLSADGNTLAVGGISDNSNIGATWVFTRTDGVWSQQGSKLVGTGVVGNAEQGTTVAISLDGNTIAVGGQHDNSNIGATWIFVRSSGIWTQQGPKLVGTGYIGTGIYQGYSVALRGNTLVVGGYGDDSNLGATWIFKRSGTGSTATWTQYGSKLVGTGYVGTNIYQGGAVSLSDDESVLITAGGEDNNLIGAVWVFKLVDGVWTQYNQKLVPTGYTGTPQFGWYTSDICISGDSSTMAFGGQDNNSTVGATWTFVGM